MLNIISNDMSPKDLATLRSIFGHTSVPSECLRFIDLKHQDIKDLNSNFFFVMGRMSIKECVRALSDLGVLTQHSFVGSDILDKENFFGLVVTELSLVEIMTSEDNKAFIWEKVKAIAEVYMASREFNDSIDDILPDSKPIEAPDASLEADLVSSEGEHTIVATDALGASDVTFNREELLQSLFEQISLTDPALEKGLSKYGVLTLDTSSGDLMVYPTSRIPESLDGHGVSFKSLIVVLKLASVLGSSSISFSKIIAGES